MKNSEKIKITISKKIETQHEVELPCYRMAWNNDKAWAIYRISGTSKIQTVESVDLYGSVPTYEIDCLTNALRERNTVATEMEWLDAIQSVINHLTNEVESACKVLTNKN